MNDWVLIMAQNPHEVDIPMCAQSQVAANDPFARLLLAVIAPFFPPLDATLAVSEFISERQTELMKARLEALADELTRQGYAPSEDNISRDNDLLHAFIVAARVTVGTRREEKIRLFGRLLSNYALGRESMSCDKFEYMLKIVDELCIEEFRVLRFLRNAETEANRSHDSHPWRQPVWEEFMRITSDQAGISTENLPGFLSRLTRTGLCAPVIGTYVDFTGGQYYTTPMLDELLKAVCNRASGESG